MVAVFVAIMLPVIIGLMAVSLDGGLLYMQRRQAQSTADAAALAGAYALYNGSTFSAAQSAAIAIGSQNGVTITKSQITEPKTNYVAVTVTSSRPRSFSALWGAGSLSVTANSVARCTSQPYSTEAIIVLDKTVKNSLYVDGASILTVTGGGVQVNSNQPLVNFQYGAFTVKDGTVTAPAIALVGGYYFELLYSSVSPNPPSAGSVVNDPMANASPPLATPSLAAAEALGTYPFFSAGYGSTVTMNPGYYPNGVTINGSTVTMNPGTYYLAGGSFYAWNSATLSGSGVTIYLSPTAITNNGTYPVALSPAALNIQSAASVNLTAPTSGAYSGMLIYVDTGNNAAVQLANSISNVSMTGTIYAPSSPVEVTGFASANLAVSNQIIADTLAVDIDTKAIINWISTKVAAKTSVALVQ
jgi:Flp pilus assembly protein TadG